MRMVFPTSSGTSKQSVKKNLEFDPDSELKEIEVEPYIQVKPRDAKLPIRKQSSDWSIDLLCDCSLDRLID